MEKEVNNLLLQLHAVQLQLQATAGTHADSEAIKTRLVRSVLYLACKLMNCFNN